VLAAAAATVATVTVVVWTMEKPAPAAKPVSPVFHQAVDLCGVLPAGQVTKLLGAPADGRDTDEGGCQWTISGAGLDLSPITDSDTPDPWSLTVESAHTLYVALERQQNSSLREGSWIWYEIGVDDKQATVRSAPRVVADVGDEAFSWNSANVRGQARMSAITFRLGNLVATLTYADLDSDSADALRQGAVEMARSAVAELRSLG
jgi:hypothetical protein